MAHVPGGQRHTRLIPGGETGEPASRPEKVMAGRNCGGGMGGGDNLTRRVRIQRSIQKGDQNGNTQYRSVQKKNLAKPPATTQLDLGDLRHGGDQHGSPLEPALHASDQPLPRRGAFWGGVDGSRSGPQWKTRFAWDWWGGFGAGVLWGGCGGRPLPAPGRARESDGPGGAAENTWEGQHKHGRQQLVWGQRLIYEEGRTPPLGWVGAVAGREVAYIQFPPVPLRGHRAKELIRLGTSGTGAIPRCGCNAGLRCVRNWCTYLLPAGPPAFDTNLAPGLMDVDPLGKCTPPPSPSRSPMNADVTLWTVQTGDVHQGFPWWLPYYAVCCKR